MAFARSLMMCRPRPVLAPLGADSSYRAFNCSSVAPGPLYVTVGTYVGIGTQSPVNRLEIGNIGSSGYGGNHIAFGNGSQASGIAQTATAETLSKIQVTDYTLKDKVNNGDQRS